MLGGCGLGLGYVSPVSTLIRWFPDRRGMATGMAIMGFGGGAFVAGYLNVFFIDRLGVAGTVGLQLRPAGAGRLQHRRGRVRREAGGRQQRTARAQELAPVHVHLISPSRRISPGSA